MKNFKFNLSNWVKKSSVKALVFGFGVLTLSSCLKNDNDNVAPNYSALAIINASPGLQPFDFVIDNQIVNQGSFDFTERLPYVNIFSGNRRIGIYKDQTADSIKTGSILAQPGKYYSLYVVGQPANLEFLTITDSVAATTTGKAQIRFLNLSVNSPSLKLNYGVDSLLINNLAYKNHSNFVEIPGGKRYNFTVKSDDVNGKTAESNVLIESGRIYTVWASGLYNNTDSLKLGVKIQRNN
ncbi:DUF4397 domain-containing protein [Pedobacter alpinus]|uniref:DUF4397 domain-containing protein n=1 Tax=Pedobacter alpinus TaxID=1590643 RepID=A0ABW5TVC5_9SPHI